MTREKILQQAQTGEERQLFSRMADLSEMACKKGIFQFSSFLSPAEQAAVKRVKELQTEAELVLDGGYEDAERKLAIWKPGSVDYEHALPVTAFEISSKNPLSHRDILGAVLAQGIKRETVGDILDTNNPPLFIALESMADFLLTNFNRAGRGEISLRQIPLTELNPVPPEVKVITATVASLRLDSVVSEGFSISRSLAADAIKAGKVAVNWSEADSPSKEVRQGDKISLKGMGKIKLEEVGGLSRKNRIFITINRYI